MVMTRKTLFALVAGAVLAATVVAQPAQPVDPPLVNWTAPPYWTPPAAGRQEGVPDRNLDVHALGLQVSALSLPSSPVPFIAVAPCRIVDTRVSNADGFHSPNFSDNETRTYTLPNSTDCPGLPTTSVAYSLNVQFRTISQAAFITLYPAGTTRPLVSTTVGNTASFVTDAAIVPAGTGGAIDVYCQYAGRVVIDINGYYEPGDIVNSLNTLTGDVTLAAGSNIAITPGGNTLTIAMTGVPGGTLPAGAAGQTLYSNGSGWLASSALTNDGTNVGITGNLGFPNTTASTGQINFGGDPFIHNYGFGNTFIGQQAGNFTMSGTYDTATGDKNLSFNTTGSNNTASGALSLVHNDQGSNNTASGAISLFWNTTGSNNTASGVESLQFNTTGSDNTASGFMSLYANSTASKNTAVGSQALFTQSYSNSNTPWDSLNTAVGYQALYSNQPVNTSDGVLNTAVGSQALQANTTGSANTTSGYQSLYSNITGSGNTATGASALYSNTTGGSNTASGEMSLYTNTGDFNTASGWASLVNNTTGYDNTATGFGAGGTNETGSSNTYVGAYSDAADTGLTNATALGANAIVDASNKVRIGNGSVTVIEGQVAPTWPSDVRLKENIRDLDLGLDFVMQLRPVSFTMKRGNGRTDMGFLAQEIEAVLGDDYNVLGIGADRDRTLSLRGTDLIAPLIKAVQEQQSQIEAKDARIAALENQQAAQQARSDAQQNQIEALRAELTASHAQRAQLEAMTARLAALEKAVTGTR